MLADGRANRGASHAHFGRRTCVLRLLVSRAPGLALLNDLALPHERDPRQERDAYDDEQRGCNGADDDAGLGAEERRGGSARVEWEAGEGAERLTRVPELPLSQADPMLTSEEVRCKNQEVLIDEIRTTKLKVQGGSGSDGKGRKSVSASSSRASTSLSPSLTSAYKAYLFRVCDPAASCTALSKTPLALLSGRSRVCRVIMRRLKPAARRKLRTSPHLWS